MVPTLAEKSSSLAYALVNDFLKIQKDNVISIAAAIHNTPDSKNPLQEIPFLEELCLAIRRKKAFPIMELRTKNLQNRFFNEMSDEVISQHPSYYSKLIETIDYFFELSWESFKEEDYSNDDSRLDQAISSSQNLLWQAFEQNKKLIFLNYPTHNLASQTGIDFNILLNIYFAAVNTDYNFLRSTGADLRDRYFSSAYYRIFNEDDSLKIRIKKDRIKVYSGNPGEHSSFVLPGGFLEIPLFWEDMNGVFLVEKAYYKGSVFNNIKIKFENGNIRYVNFKEDKPGNYEFQNALNSCLPECNLLLGFNKDIFQNSNYYYYDRCRDGNLSLSFMGQKFNRFYLLGCNSEIERC